MSWVLFTPIERTYANILPVSYALFRLKVKRLRNPRGWLASSGNTLGKSHNPLIQGQRWVGDPPEAKGTLDASVAA
ncbi:hypothetical protein PSAB6_570046 [Paraburkholderia sabiae]|nr:hypothetical protein PSAB6_570046 [Paraburkholderia sabiae]